MSSPPVQVRTLARSVEFAGRDRRHGWIIAAAFTRLGARYHRGLSGGWLVHPLDAEDAMAALEADGHRIEVVL